MLHDGLGLARGVPLHVLLQQLLGLPVLENLDFWCILKENLRILVILFSKIIFSMQISLNYIHRLFDLDAGYLTIFRE